MKRLFLTVLAILLATTNIAFAKINVKNYQKGIYIVKINPKQYAVRTFVVDTLKKSEDVYNENDQFVAVLNGGYFDFGNKKTVSFVLRDGEIIADPMENEHLSENQSLKPDLDLILNRGEFRRMDCSGKIEYDILKHYDVVKDGCKIVDSLQAGPIIYPELKSEEEFFVRKDAYGKIKRDAIQAYSKKPRTAVAIKNNKVYFILATRQHPMTLDDLYRFSEKHHFEKVLNLDGGGSTSFDDDDISIKSEKGDVQRRVKSFLVVEEI